MVTGCGGVLLRRDQAELSLRSVVAWRSVRQLWMPAYPAGVWQVQTRPRWGGVGQVLVRTSDAPTPDREHSSLSRANTDGFLWVWQPCLTLRWSRAGKCSGCHSQDSAGQQPTAERHLKKWTVSILVASLRRGGKAWKYRAASLHVDSGDQTVREGEGSTQIGELIAVWSVFTREADTKESVLIYTDSYAVFKGCTEWLPFWEQNQWEVNRIPAWQQEKREEILNIAKQKTFLVGWVAAHQAGNHLAHL